jgi:hypothetical protein
VRAVRGRQREGEGEGEGEKGGRTAHDKIICSIVDVQIVSINTEREILLY